MPYYPKVLRTLVTFYFLCGALISKTNTIIICHTRSLAILFLYNYYRVSCTNIFYPFRYSTNIYLSIIYFNDFMYS